MSKADPSPTAILSNPKPWLVAVAIASVAGMVIARLLPYIYPSTFGRILESLGFNIHPYVSPSRDSANRVLMTVLTFAAAFAIAFYLVLRSGKKDRAM